MAERATGPVPESAGSPEPAGPAEPVGSLEPAAGPAWWPCGRAADAALTGALAVLMVAWPAVTGHLGKVSATGWLIIASTLVAMFVRRSCPVTAGAVTLVATAAYLVLPDPDGPIVLTFAIALYTLMSRGRFAWAVLLAAAAIVASLYGEYSTGGEHLGDLGVLFFSGWLVSVAAIGGAVYGRRAYRQEADARMRAMAHGQEEELRRRTTEERLRIARELHDVLGHTISLINVQASAALHGRDARPEQMPEALGTIKESSGHALQEMRRTLGTLRQVGEAAPTVPAPSLAGVADLVQRTVDAGLPVWLDVQGSPPERLPPAVDLAGYRIVQEALTNVARHAGATEASVRIRYADDVEIDVVDDGRSVEQPAGTGSGIVGMRERARAAGGELTAGPRDGGGFAVHARLPVGGS